MTRVESKKFALPAATTTQEANANGGKGGNGVAGRKHLVIIVPTCVPVYCLCILTASSHLHSHVSTYTQQRHDTPSG